MENDGADKIVRVDGDDEEMLSAINTARQSLRQFLDPFFALKSN
jgi:hypothetical protein